MRRMIIDSAVRSDGEGDGDGDGSGVKTWMRRRREDAAVGRRSRSQLGVGIARCTGEKACSIEERMRTEMSSAESRHATVRVTSPHRHTRDISA